MLSNPYIAMAYIGMFSFFVEIFTIQALFMRKFKRRKLFSVRLGIGIALAVGFAFLPMLRIGFINTSFLIIAIYSTILHFIIFEANVLNCVFYAIAAWSVQHIASHILWIICSFVQMSNGVNLAVYLIIYLTVYSLMFFAFSFKRNDYKINGDKITILIVSLISLLIVWLIHDFIGEFAEWTVWHSVFAIMSCMLVLFVQFGLTDKQKLKREREEVESENAILQGLLNSQAKQQKLSNETIEIINCKCHDLKHQINSFRKLKPDDVESYLKEIERAVLVYGDIAKTGNYALDIALTEKCLICEEHKIKFTYIVDGESLSFIQPADISALFGNIINNAIECEDNEEENKRIIRMNVNVNCGYLRIHCENYCSHEVEFENELPKTSKEDSTYHGFGVKSIRFIAEKYGGKIVMYQADGLFNVNIIIPLKTL